MKINEYLGKKNRQFTNLLESVENCRPYFFRAICNLANKTIIKKNISIPIIQMTNHITFILI